MVHLPALIQDLGLILAAAGTTTLLFKKIKQPLVLGYIIAGLLVGPHISLLPTVADTNNINVWAEIGVIFLLFSLGLEFSFKKLAHVGGSASITAIVEVVVMLLIGYFIGIGMGWSTMDSIFLGGILSISSTTIIIRAFEELGVKHKKFAGLVFGVLIVEDLVAILLLVLLSTLAVSREFAGTEMLLSILKLLFFLILWFVGGIFLIPTFLKRTKNLMNDETMLVVSLALCLVMVILAVQVGFSPALGAFIMGSILAETTQAERIEHLTKSVKDLFAAVFFVSVGMLINPSIIAEYALPIFLVTVSTIVGKLLSSGLGALLSGQPLKTSVQTGMSLAQIGEFSFIIATLGNTLNVTSEFLYPVAVAASAVTTFTTPYLIKYSGSFYNGLNRILPQRWTKAIERYSTSTSGIAVMSDWKVLLRSLLVNTTIHGVIVVALIYLSVQFFQPLLVQQFDNDITAKIINIVISFIVLSPFLWALSLKKIERRAYSHLWLNKKYSRGPLVAIEIARILLSIGFIGILLTQIFTTSLAIIAALLIGIVAFGLFSSRLKKLYDRLENVFVVNLNEREKHQSGPDILPWDMHLTTINVAPESDLMGATLEDLKLREKFGINIAMIQRGQKIIPIPEKNERLFPHDQLSVIGSDDQLASIKSVLQSPHEKNQPQEFPKETMNLIKIILRSDSSVTGKTLRESNLRQQAQALIVGIERGVQKILNPPSDFKMEVEDVLWIVGDSKKIKTVIEGGKTPQ